ncbi:MAG: hypothetical protein QHH07_07955, partial [Sedimentisphaerales bacterium]|nr:hypothetical protein [Sedimentisphaerales bacterium]
GPFTRIMICHVDPNGNPGKPFVMPQEDPQLYHRGLLSYNTPELLVSKPTYAARLLYKAARARPTVKPSMAITSATPKLDQLRPPTERN